MGTVHELVKLSEAEWQEQITDLATLCGWRWNHVRRSIKGSRGGWVTPTSCVGWPDLVLWHPTKHRILYVEVKTDRGRLTSEQRDVLATLAAAGGEVHVWRPSGFDDVRRILTGGAS